MNLISTLGKKYVKEILSTLNKNGPLHVNAIKNITKCSNGTITNRINELEKKGLIITYKKRDRPGLSPKICKITNLGKKALTVYDIDKD